MFQILPQVCFRRSEASLGALRSVAISHITGAVVAGWNNGVVHLWSKSSTHSAPPAAAAGASGSPKARRAQAETARASGAGGFADVKALKGHVAAVTSAKFCDAGMLFTACLDGRLKLWDVVGTHIGRYSVVCCNYYPFKKVMRLM